jgi:hypothetical protein
MTQEIADSESAAVAVLPHGRAADRHSRKCQICRHPLRALIECSFLSRRSPSRIARQFGFNDRNTVYRHAHATKLFDLRGRGPLVNRNMRRD